MILFIWLQKSQVQLIILLGFPHGLPFLCLFTLVKEWESLCSRRTGDQHCIFELVALSPTFISWYLLFVSVSPKVHHVFTIILKIRINKCIWIKLETTLLLTNGEAGLIPFPFWTHRDFLLVPKGNQDLRDLQ